MKSAKLFFVSALALLSTGLLYGQQNAADEARAGETRQTQIQGETNKVAAELDAMLDEYQRNGVADDELKAVKSLRELLGSLSQEDMTRILHLLQDASAKGDPRALIKAISDAYAGQKGIISQLKHVLADYEHGQEAEELSRRAKDLAERQAANLQAGIAAAQWALDGDRPQEEVNASIEAQAAEEKSIADEMKLLQAKVAEVAKNPANAAMAARFKQGLDEMSQLSRQLEAAEAGLAQKQLFNGVEQEKTARDQMRQLARTIAPQRNAVEALEEAAENLDKAVAQQQGLNAEAQLAQVKPIEQWAADVLKHPQSGLGKELKEKGLDKLPVAQLVGQKLVADKYKQVQNQAENLLPDLENRQGDLLGQNDALSQDLDAVAKPAADDLRAAMTPLQAARTAMNDKKADAAVAAQKQALGAMEKAQADVHQRLAAAEKAQNQPADPLERLTKLQEQTQQLAQAQADLAAATAAPMTPPQAAAAAQAEAALKEKANDIAQQAAADAPAAAKSVAKAADNMQQARADLANPAAAAQAAPAQAAAVQNLAQAAQQLGDQMKQAAQAKAGAAGAKEALDGLTKIIAQEQQLELETVAKAAAAAKLSTPIVELAPRQQTIASEFETVRKGPPAPPPHVGVPLVGGPPAPAPAIAKLDPTLAASAAGHMDEAKAQLLKGNGKDADPAERKALDDLYALQKKAAAQSASAANAAAQAKAATALAQAQAQAAQAMKDMGKQQGGAPKSAAPQAGGQQASAPQPAQQAGGQPAGAPEAGAPQAGGQQAGAPQPGAPQPGGPQPGDQPAGDQPGGQQPGGDQAGAGQLAQAASTAGQAAADGAGLPDGVQDAMRAAAEALAAAGSQAGAGNASGAAKAAQAGAAALAQAQAALAQAQTGISGPPSSSSAGGPSSPQGPAGTTVSNGPPGPGGKGEGSTAPGGITTGVAGNGVIRKAGFLGLPARERATIQQSQAEKYPQEYAAQVEQYLQNLADESSPH